ncbi:MAG TPA: flagellar basal body rod protein FlgC [Rhizomicrobium sp.]|jgi:flagellar basal-body rod protein FlgC|nr:flagellar basal body rod protein FlgC [Rhizomicrobium sp.]
MEFSKSMSIAAAGMRVQSDRMKVIAENIANADSTSPTPGGDPYRRKVSTVTQSFDRELGVNLVETGKTVADKSDFRSQYDPGNPTADAKGYVKLPNVDPLIEIMDMKEAQRSYEADLTVMTSTKQMMSQAVSLLNK